MKLITETLQNINIIQEYSKYTNEWSGNILEPSCGSCEYVIELCIFIIF